MLPRVASFAQPSPLDRFRAKPQRLRLHPLESALLWIVGAHLIFLPWAIGGSTGWAHFISLGLAVVGLVVALLPRTYTGEYTQGPDFRLLSWPKLVRFPLFWAGLALLVYVTIQACNPAWTYQTDGKSWWLSSNSPVKWLPTSVSAPFQRGNPWRHLTIYASAWLVGCTIWIGFTRRRTLQFLLTALAVNAFVLTAFGLLQRLAGSKKIYGLVASPVDTFFAGFIYRNHAGAYLNLMLALCIGLAAWFYFRGLRRMEKSNPAGIFAFFACVVSVGVIITFSRGSILILVLFLPLALGLFLFHQFRHPSLPRKPAIVAVLVLAFAAFVGLGLEALSAEKAWLRIDKLLENRDTSIEVRRVATTAAGDMYRDYWLAGTGASGFRYLFPPYQERYPVIYGPGRQTNQYWEHVHNDWIEIPLELGALPMLLLIFCQGYWLLMLVRQRAIDHPLCLMLVAGCVLTVVHARIDFVFQNPAVLVTWCAFWPIVARWAEEER